MSLDYLNRDLPGSAPSHELSEVYESSVPSSASSSQLSVFSADSAHSSIATSVSDDFRSCQEDIRERDRICAQPQLQYQSQLGQVQHGELNQAVAAHLRQTGATIAPTYADVTSVPASQRQHPRRCSVSKDRKPPQLVRQRDRKVDFVDNLVDSATQMVEVIWPLSVVHCPAESSQGRGVLPLRTYIEETLRRSRTSYSTLQVALYYLILIMPLVPRTDFTMEQASNCPAGRALLCGRRMFLSALILASKYLQDRNYSAKAWSKMSGLKINEINTNERTFLEKVNWRLHIPKPMFEKWQELVLRYTPRPPACGADASPAYPKWKDVVPLLTPELDTVPMPNDPPRPPVMRCSGFLGLASPAATPLPSTSSMLDPFEKVQSSSLETTPTPSTVLPRFLEPKPDLLPPTPALARMGPLPTPQMTPSTVASNTPAASVCGSRRPSICSAMAQVQRNVFSRCAMDSFNPAELRNALSRRPSCLSSLLSSSPDSMISDRPRPSRSSSISSISSISTAASFAPDRACLARQATCRNVRLPRPSSLREVHEHGSVAKPIVIDDDDVEMTASPDLVDFSQRDKVLHAPHRHSKYAAQPTYPRPVPSLDRSRKRSRPHYGGGGGGHGRNDAEEEIYAQLQEYHAEEMEVDEQVAPHSDAVYYARHLLSRASPDDAAHVPSYQKSPSPLSNRIAIKNARGNKRSCMPAMAEPVPLSRQ